jgi:hypothetical protein
MLQKLSGNIGLTQNLFEKNIWNLLVSILKNDDGILGYKIPSLGNRDNEVPSFVYRSQKYGIIIIDVVSTKIVNFAEDFQYWIAADNNEIYSRERLIYNYFCDIRNKMCKSAKLFDIIHESLTFGDSNIHTLIIFPDNKESELQKIGFKEKSSAINYMYDEYPNGLETYIQGCETNVITKEQIGEINSVLDGTSVFNRKRERVFQEGKTKNDLIKESLRQTFILDSTQRCIALQVPNGPQRIRGLAGTGKTIILSMKAALTQINNEQFKILFVFNTQSMYNQILSNIEKYTIEEARRIPDWNNLKIMHAWGGTRKEGLYSYLCSEYEMTPKTYYDARNEADPYQYIYSDFLSTILR